MSERCTRARRPLHAQTPSGVLALLLLLGSRAAGQSLGSSWAIKGATLIDGTGSRAIEASVVAGRGEQILCVGRAGECAVRDDAVVVDVTGKWLIPGLIDTHVHLNWAERPDDTRRDQLIRLAFGITTVREAGTAGNFAENLAARAHARAPASPEPRVVVSGLISRDNIQRYGGRDVKDLVNGLATRGADAIKIKEERSDDEIRRVVAAAHANGLPVFGHTWWSRSHLDAALSAGIDGLSHMTTIASYAVREGNERPAAPTGIEYWAWVQEQWADADPAKEQAAIDAIVQRGVWLEPMLVNEEHFTFPYPLTDDVAYLGDVPSLRTVVRPWIPGGDSGWPRATRRRARVAASYAHICDFVARFHARGGIVVTGTDDDQPGPALLEEVRLLAQCGLSPAEALQAATKHAAAALHRRDLGTVETGRLADLVIVEADPLRDLANLQHIWGVVKGGYLHKPSVLLGPIIDAYQRQVRTTYALRAAGGVGILLTVAAVFVAGRGRPRGRNKREMTARSRTVS